jgi:hypothetical protein
VVVVDDRADAGDRAARWPEVHADMVTAGAPLRVCGGRAAPDARLTLVREGSTVGVVSNRTCPRCGKPAQPPSLWSDTWTCATHGGVAPLHAAMLPSDDVLRAVAKASHVPLWLPWPLPRGWLVTGVQWAGDERSGPVATVLACSGPNPLPAMPDERSADLLLVAEQPAVGLGARLAGLNDVDPGERAGQGPPSVRLNVASHDTPLWDVRVDDVTAYVGEAAGVWLWFIAWPVPAAAVLLERFELRDLRDPGHVLDLRFGALSPRIR